MNEAFELTEYERRLCAGDRGYFFSSCVQFFAFLVTEHGYEMSFHEMGRGFHQVKFMQDIQTEYFAVRVFHEEWDAVWCDIHRFAGTDHQRFLRLSKACLALGIRSPSERVDTSLPLEQTVPKRVSELADCIRGHLDEFRNISIKD